MKKTLSLFILLNLFLQLFCQDVNLGAKIEQKLQEDDINNYEEDHSIDELMKNTIK